MVSGPDPSKSLPADQSANIAPTFYFLAETSIKTPGGEVSPQALRQGDSVWAASGQVRTIKWIGTRVVHASGQSGRDLRALVCIEQDAISPGKPARDLRMIPDHAIFIEGKFIPVRMLVNGASIYRVDPEYYVCCHIELDCHDLLFAEGVEAAGGPGINIQPLEDVSNYSVVGRGKIDGDETGRDETDGDEIDMSAEAISATYSAHGYLHLTMSPQHVRPVWQKLALRADARIGSSIWSDDPRLRLLVGWMEIEPALIEGNEFSFDLPLTCPQVRILSRAAIPRDRRPWVEDRRRLGVAVRHVTCRNKAGEVTVLRMADPALTLGWYGVESRPGFESFRWTDGSATLTLPAGTVAVTVMIVGTVEYRDAGTPIAGAARGD